MLQALGLFQEKSAPPGGRQLKFCPPGKFPISTIMCSLKKNFLSMHTNEVNLTFRRRNHLILAGAANLMCAATNLNTLFLVRVFIENQRKQEVICSDIQ